MRDWRADHSPLRKHILLLDALGAFEDMPTWDDAADSLFNAGQTLNPSALHGAMSGLLGAGFNPNTEHHFSATVAALEKALAVELTGIWWILFPDSASPPSRPY
jgi:hypothetical protein